MMEIVLLGGMAALVALRMRQVRDEQPQMAYDMRGGSPHANPGTSMRDVVSRLQAYPAQQSEEAMLQNASITSNRFVQSTRLFGSRISN